MKLSLLTCALALVLPTIAYSQQPPREPRRVELKVAPDRYQATLQHGHPKDGLIDVFNIGAKAVTVQAEVDSIRMVGASGALGFYSDDRAGGIQSLVQVDRKPFRLQPGEARRVKFRLSLSGDAWSGGYFGAILFRVVTKRSGGASSVQQTGRVGTLLVLKATGKADRRGAIRSFRYGGDDVLGSRRSFSASYANTGNTDKDPLGIAYRPAGTLTARNVFGVKVSQKNVEGALILPGAERTMAMKMNSSWWFGRHAAQLQIAVGPDGKAQSKTIHFWAFSALPVAVLVTIATLASMLLIYRRRRSEPPDS